MHSILGGLFENNSLDKLGLSCAKWVSGWMVNLPGSGDWSFYLAELGKSIPVKGVKFYKFQNWGVDKKRGFINDQFCPLMTTTQ